MTAKTFQRWSKSEAQQDGRIKALHVPKNKLTELEVQRVLNTANEPEFADLAPSQIVPKLADKGVYVASESTFYRVLNSHNQLKHRGKNKPGRKANKPQPLIATAPNQIYTWDITYLSSQIRGIFFYLYLVLDIYSRKIVGWQVHDKELSSLAAELMIDICHREKVKRDQVILHSDNGSPMKGATMLSTLQNLGVMPSFSRPSVSNDNPFSESLFRTLKYRPLYPEQQFKDLLTARNWVNEFVRWYNFEHCHSGIKFVTPVQRHTGADVQILANRKAVYQQAKLRNPARWSGNIRNWEQIEEVHLNPEKSKTKEKENKAA